MIENMDLIFKMLHSFIIIKSNYFKRTISKCHTEEVITKSNKYNQ